MVQLTKKHYEQQKAHCDGLCTIENVDNKPSDATQLPCVTCPFCKEIVTAILTPKTIQCPSCKIIVER